MAADEFMTIRCRVMQDRFLALPEIQDRIARDGEVARIHGPSSPTYAEVRQFVIPAWESFFKDAIKQWDTPL